jgi:hypothetical protein
MAGTYSSGTTRRRARPPACVPTRPSPPSWGCRPPRCARGELIYIYIYISNNAALASLVGPPRCARGEPSAHLALPILHYIVLYCIISYCIVLHSVIVHYIVSRARTHRHTVPTRFIALGPSGLTLLDYIYLSIFLSVIWPNLLPPFSLSLSLSLTHTQAGAAGPAHLLRGGLAVRGRRRRGRDAYH